MNLTGRVAVVTGSSRGVGRATGLALARKRCSVVVNYRQSKAEAEETTEQIRGSGGQAICLQADISLEHDCRSLMDRAAREWGRLDILVNNAATTEFIPFSDLDGLTDAHWDGILRTNVKGPFYCARAAASYLDAAPGGGEIVNITSVAGILGNGSSIAYCASKAALINMTIALARALAPRVRVNSVAPGFIADQWTRQGLGANYGTAKQRHQERALLGKVCEPEDVAAAVSGLIEGSDMVTGQTLICDGGMTVGP